LKSLSFLEGEWSAATPGGANGPNVIGACSFKKELGGHILARHSSNSSCKGPADFDCDHGDLLYVYVDGPAQALKAIYFDNEGHVIHYNVSTPTSSSVIFLSDPSSRPSIPARVRVERRRDGGQIPNAYAGAE
jgi:hypothetical protein